MKITATSEKKCNEIYRATTPYGSYWAAVRLVGWISQNKTNGTTTLYFKWQVGANNYWPYWYTSHTYSVAIGSTTKTSNFQLPQATNSWVDLAPTQSITVTHTNGSYSGSLSVSGYKYFEAFTQTIAISFPDISTSGTNPDSTADSNDTDPAVIENDEYDSRYYIFCDGVMVYAPNDEEHIVTSPQLDISLNETDSLSFVLPPANDMYSKINKLSSTIEVRQGKDILFRGRVIDDTTDFNNLKTVNCEGAKAFFSDTVMPPFLLGTYPTAKSFFYAIVKQHNEQAKEPREIKYVKCDVTKDIEVESDEYQSCAEALSQLLEQADGYFKLEYFEDGTTGISFLSSYNKVSTQAIELGVNLLDVSVTVDATSIYTSVLPLGAKKDVYFQTTDTTKKVDKTYYTRSTSTTDGITKTSYSEFTEAEFASGGTYYEKGLSYRLRIGERSAGYVEDASAIEKFGRIVRTFTFDDVDNVDEDGREIAYIDKLRELGAVYLQAGLGADVTIEGKLVDLHIIDPTLQKLHVGDSVKIFSIPHNLDGYYTLSACSLQLQNPDQSQYTFGATIRALTDI